MKRVQNVATVGASSERRCQRASGEWLGCCGDLGTSERRVVGCVDRWEGDGCIGSGFDCMGGGFYGRRYKKGQHWMLDEGSSFQLSAKSEKTFSTSECSVCITKCAEIVGPYFVVFGYRDEGWESVRDRGIGGPQ